MTLVARGLGLDPSGSILVAYGLGTGTTAVIVIDLEQITETKDMLQAAGIAEKDISVETLDAQTINLAVVVAKDPTGVLDEYLVQVGTDSPLQRVEIVDRPIDIDVRTVTLDMGLIAYQQKAGLGEIAIQVEAVDSGLLQISLVVADGPQGVIDVYEQETDHAQSIDKIDLD